MLTGNGLGCSIDIITPWQYYFTKKKEDKMKDTH
ncbi:hypothetical protein Xenpb_03655 [Xenorhabdus sp. PB62.4]|nr:hypothetical protein [Xenorhabdus sp. PB62.4]